MVAPPASAQVLEPPPAPVPPATIVRDDRGGVTVRAVRLGQPLALDGRLDEQAYADAQPAGDFIQMEPVEGQPSTEKTEAWVFFDDETIFVSVRCWDGQPDRWLVTELRRDNNNIIRNENVAVSLDTFNDGRNGFFFQTTPAGALRDQTFTDEANPNVNWNTIWDVKAARFDGGWAFEMAIPFKSLRYRGSGAQTWRINFRRIIGWKNETTFLTHMPAAYGGNGPFRMSLAATLVGLETPAQSMNLEIKPYATSALTTDRAAAAPFSNRLSKNAGFDFKYGLTRSLIADATFRTDFAQVEEDVQQVNLTRFSLFFPEKREFFLEGQGIFAFGGVSTGGFGFNAAGDLPILFFSRRIGLSRGQPVQVVGGGRVTGTIGKFGVGLLNIQTDELPSAGAASTNFSVVRLKRDILRRSSIGVLATYRTPTAAGSGANSVVGADANLSFYRHVLINTYVATSQTSGALSGGNSSYRARFDYAADDYGLLLEHVLVGERFNPEIGFTRRLDFSRSTVTARFSPRPRSSRLIRKLNWVGTQTYITSADRTVVENRQTFGNFGIDFNNSDRWDVEYVRDYEFVPVDFQISPAVTVATGGYRYETFRTYYSLGQQRRISGQFSVATGSFYGGRKTDATYTAGRATLSTYLSVEPGVTLNWVDLPAGRFRNELLTLRAIFTPGPRSLINGLVQYNQTDRTISSSVRLRWEYTAGSELFVVYSDGRNTEDARVPGLVNRSFAVKLTRLFRM